MRILMLAPIWERVPPRAYGGIEVVVYDLIEQLVARGHAVTLWASGDSSTSARGRSVVATPLRASYDEWRNPELVHWAHVAGAIREAAAGYDLVHNHAGELAMAMAPLIETPTLTTFHGPPNPELNRLWRSFASPFNTISRSASRGCHLTGNLGIVYNGIDVRSFPFGGSRGDDLLFLSRISPEKGPLEAIEVARRSGRRLILAGKVDHADREFFATRVEPLIDGRQIVFFGEADGAQKRELYARAAALLLPITWPEPFGLVMAEAGACGTPVIAFPNGAAPEIVVDGVTGFLVPDIDGMVAALARLDEIDPQACRDHVLAHFDASIMATRYEELYRRLVRLPRGPLAAESALSVGRERGWPTSSSFGHPNPATTPAG